MARTLRHPELATRTARARLPAGERHWADLDAGVDIGYRRGPRGGKWLLRIYTGERRYCLQTLGIADDVADADGHVVLDFATAQKKARERRVEIVREQQGLPAAASGPYTVKQALDDYLTWLEEHRRSAQDARYRAEAQIVPQLGDVECSKLTTPTLQKWLRDLAATAPRIRSKKNAKAPSYRKIDGADQEALRRRRATTNRVLTTLKAALNRAWQEGKIPSDAAWRRVKSFKGVDAARVRYLSVAECKRMINACGPDFRRLVQAALATGCRYGELAALRAADFNADAGTVHIQRSKSGKGRHVVLTDEGRRLFSSLAAGQPGEALLLSKADGSPWGDCHQLKRMAAASKRAKIVPSVNFHALRHTWASLSVMGGVPLAVVAANLGHADTRMVERHYGHLAPSYVADQIRAGAPRFSFKIDRKLVAIGDRR